ncbi:bifunctional [glutamine synthetase] adenylyltransferase/[glutamine synthetase]-adenylyl-L-tyrosine phosphorylase [Enterovirga sp.]|uniref:bifunctional [glutamine synthetase] adenylyltransferase/[glutamine synthetase]-adenylyl-L-tyrosine phosphorylase n=1 Tax=Enterovirga sp. TaxID=2026350 RepID=UPI002C1C5AC2|nr:bifunctional [glutamine synthetase] adenylyltransferase/[glutamine synthetase]-adenylyl-L-tyrosine phosphorylase [Enterovirga sp.]HMO29117.1 bifunctional [glutamine synthetase] adenylyltransferase/[glutamine synthetase]-adenylyl-L-tyrosine phosphorylase [Enterovirga sp.]
MTESLASRAHWGRSRGEAAFEAVLEAIRVGSPFLRELAEADEERLARFAATPPEEAFEAIRSAQAGLLRRFEAGDLDRDGVAVELRRNRGAQALLVALADLAGTWPVDRVTQALSDFADASVATALGVALREAVESGKLDGERIGEDGAGCGVTFLALGKHGAGELNYSSDIDLVVFYDPHAPAVRDAHEAGRIFMRIAQGVLKLLSERTAEGYVHRVDYRLRPDPGSTPVAVSLPAAYTYYETVGQNWERAAMIKARPVAGDRALGETFLQDLRPFIWRKYFDFNAIADIHAMKRQIHAVRGHGSIAVEGHDIKLGRGGIREIEFFVQTQQLVFGGRRPALRGRRTLDMLAELHREGWVTEKARDELSEAYRFLRGIEHRLQMVADEQTQRLPSDAQDLAAFARFAGYSGLPAFAKALTAQAKRVERHYGLLFEDAPELASDLGDLVFTGTEDDPATLATLSRLGFRDPPKVAETIRGWHFGRRPAIISARAREVLTELVPALLKALGGTADPDGGLAYLDTAFARMPAAVELLGILRQHERLRLLFADLLGTAPRLADEVAARPHVLDPVLDPAFSVPVRDEEAIEREFLGLVGKPEGFEEFLDRIRDAAHQLEFVTGARLLSGILAPHEAGLANAAIARAAIRAALARVEAAFEGEHGKAPGGHLAVLGLGRLGARNLTPTSDLDLVVLYEFNEKKRTSDGDRPLDSVVYHLRLTQRLVAALTVPTRRGRLFEVDLRLRPAGSKGPIATQFKGFLAYHDGEAELWEEMALTRARVLAGPPAFRARIEKAIAAVLRRPREQRHVYEAVHDMRTLVGREKGDGGELDLKLSPGALLDLDFLAQALVLAHAAEHGKLVGMPAIEVFAEAGRLGLLARDDARVLAEAYRMLDDVMHWQRLTLGAQGEEGAETPGLRARLAALVGAPDPKVLGAHLAEIRRPVREIFDRVLRA